MGAVSPSQGLFMADLWLFLYRTQPMNHDVWSHIRCKVTCICMLVHPLSIYVCIYSFSYFHFFVFLIVTSCFFLSGICTAQSITDCRRHYTSCVNIENAANEAEVLEVQCSLRNDTIHCLKQAKDDFNCIPLIIQVSSHLSNEIGEFCQLCHRNSTTNCDPTAPPEPIPSPAPSPTPDPTNSPENCSSLPPSYPSSNHNLGAPSLTPPPTSRDCTMPYYKTFHRQQCSAYTLSHIRSFGDRRRSVETCFLPGWWYLLKHQWLEVAVRGEAMHNGRSGNDYTVVSEVSTVAAWGQAWG